MTASMAVAEIPSLTGAAGNDDLGGNQGNDSLSGGAGDDFLSGDAGDDFLSGGAGNDFFFRNEGNDFLSGGAGGDDFYFIAPGEGIDRITDFDTADDSIRVFVEEFGGESSSFGDPITPEEFRIGSAAVDATDRFIYNQNTGALFFDSDGTGTNRQVQLASLSTGLNLTNNDIIYDYYD